MSEMLYPAVANGQSHLHKQNTQTLLTSVQLCFFFEVEENQQYIH